MLINRPEQRTKIKYRSWDPFALLYFEGKVGFFFTSDKRYTAAIEAPRNIDKQRHLPVKNTVLRILEQLHSS
jgi:hypothetical protein